MADVFGLITARRSIPKFTPDPVPREIIERMLEAATWAPNHHLTEPWEFTVLQDGAIEAFAEIRRRFRLTLFPNPQAPEAQKAVRKIYDDTRRTPAIIIVTTRVSADSALSEDDFAATWCGIQNMLLVAAAAGVGTYPRTGTLIHAPALRAWLGLPADRRIAAVVYVGYPALIPERRRTPFGEKTRWMTDVPGVSAEAAASADPAPAPARSREESAIDPVCKMEVDVATAEYTSTYAGRTFYFCAPGCKAAFEADPASYLKGS